MPLVPWLVANAAATLCSLVGVKLQRNVKIMFRERGMTALNFRRSQVAIAWMSSLKWGEWFIVDFE